MTAAVVDQRTYARRWWTLGTLCLCITVIGVDNTILNVALPSIVRDLGATGSQLQLIVDGYTVVFAGLLLTGGSLGDRYGRRHALMAGLGWFGLFSVAASRAASPTELIMARAAMGIGGAFIFPTTLSVLTNTFSDPAERATAIGIWAGVSGIGIALGPLAGGLLVERFGWASVFLVNVPVCGTALVLTWLFVPNSSHRAESPLDPVGAVLSIVGLMSLLYGVIEGPDQGWVTGRVALPLVGGMALLVAFAWWEWRNPRPMLDVRFFTNPRFSAASATITLAFFGLYASTFLMTQYFQFILGYSPLRAGVMIVPNALGMMIAGPLSPRLVRHLGTKRVVVVGLGLLAAAMGLFGSNTVMSQQVLSLGARFLLGFGIGLTTPPVTESIMGSLPPSRAGVGSAVNDTTRQTGGAVGVAVIGSVFAARYHAAIGSLGFLAPASRASARESIGTSLDVASRLGAPERARLVHLAHLAYLDSMRLTYALSVAIVGLAALVAYRWLPATAPTHVGEPGRPTPTGAPDRPGVDGPATTGMLAGATSDLGPAAD